jgi:ABC-type enterochelin transport system ATPase subunit
MRCADFRIVVLHNINMATRFCDEILARHSRAIPNKRRDIVLTGNCPASTDRLLLETVTASDCRI